MIVQKSIESKLKTNLEPSHLQVLNESHMHSVPENSETHFKVIVVSDVFTTKNRVARHQLINGILSAEIAGPVHALSIQAHTEEEWLKRKGMILKSPDCANAD
jgi:BolA protein